MIEETYDAIAETILGKEVCIASRELSKCGFSQQEINTIVYRLSSHDKITKDIESIQSIIKEYIINHNLKERIDNIKDKFLQATDIKLTKSEVNDLVAWLDLTM